MGSNSKTNFAAPSRHDASPAPLAANVHQRVDPPAGEPSFKEWAQAIARQRLATLASFDKLAPLKGNAKAATLVGSSVVSLWRWRQAYDKYGLAGLLPKQPSGGRRSPVAQVKLSAKALREIERLAAELGSARAAWHRFAANPQCPPALAKYIDTHGTAPARLAGLVQVREVKARCYLAGDGRRLLVALPCHGTVSMALAIRGGLQPVTLPKATE